MACQWEDEQTGGHCPILASKFTGTSRSGSPSPMVPTSTRSTRRPSTVGTTSCQLYVANQAPALNAAVVAAAAPVIYQQAMGLPVSDPVTMPLDPIQTIPTYGAALTAFEKLPQVRVLFDNGAGKSPTRPGHAGQSLPDFEQSFSSLPIPGTTRAAWYLGANGTLDNQRPRRRRSTRTRRMRTRLPLTDFSGPVGPAACGATPRSGVALAAEPIRYGGLVPHLAVGNGHHGHRSGCACICGCVPRRRMSIYRPRSARSTRTATRHSSRTATCGRVNASWRPESHTIFDQPSTLLNPIPSMRAADSQPMPAGKFVEVGDPALLRGTCLSGRQSGSG